MYMLKSVGDRTPPCGTPFMNWQCVDVCLMYFVCECVYVYCVELFAHV